MTGTITVQPRLQNAARQGLIQLLAVAIAFCGFPGKAVFAQAAEQDFEAPLIEHERIASGKLSEAQVFSANVVDNTELKSVILFYRFSGDEHFEQIEMQQIEVSSFFSATISADQLPDVETNIEYYLQAEDAAGNIVLKGYVFDPLSRSLGAELAISRQGSDAATTQTETPKKSRTLYYIAGVVGLLALAALANSGGDDDKSECGTEGCLVNLVVTPP